MRKIWTPGEIRELMTRYPAEGAVGVAKRLDRSIDSVSSKARRYRLRSETRRKRQGQSKACQSQMVNARFFEQLTSTVAYTVGFIWGCGGIKGPKSRVLRISVDRYRHAELKAVLSLLNSRHQVQKHGQKLVVEVCNSFLVASLVNNFGRPAFRHPIPAFPNIPDGLISPFAKGHLDAAGFVGDGLIRWNGHPETLRILDSRIRIAIAVNSPLSNLVDRRLNIVWKDEDDVERLRNWLKYAPAT